MAGGGRVSAGSSRGQALQRWCASAGGYRAWRGLLGLGLVGSAGLYPLAQHHAASAAALSLALVLLALLTPAWVLWVPSSEQMWPASGTADERFPPGVVDVEDCVGWKAALLLHREDGFWLRGAAGGLYRGSASSSCLRTPEHCPPQVGCTCGFHAWHEREVAEAYKQQLGSEAVLLEVGLTGSILEYEQGVRAEGQEVLGLLLPSRCSCGSPATGLCAPVSRRGVCIVCCPRCAEGDCFTLGELRSGLGLEAWWGVP